MIETKNKTALQSQQWLLEALLDLMQEMDYTKITVSALCRRAQLDRRTFYRNFDSKQDVLQQYIEQLSGAYAQELEGNPPRTRHAATLLFFRFWKKHLRFIQNMQASGISHTVFEAFRRFSETQEALRFGRDVPSREPDYKMAFQIGGFWNVMLSWAAADAATPPEELARILSEEAPGSPAQYTELERPLSGTKIPDGGKQPDGQPFTD